MSKKGTVAGLDDMGMTVAENVAIMRLLLENDRYPLLLGDRGIGKSQTAFQVAEEMGYGVYYLNCSQTDAESLVYPSIVERIVDGEDGNVLHRAIDLITIDGLDKPMVVLLDEITNARPSLQSTLLSFVNEKRLGGRHFPHIKFIATGNFNHNSPLAGPLPRPLMERFCILEAPVPSRTEWMSYMRKNYPKTPPYYYAFIQSLSESEFYKREDSGGDVEDFQQSPSPRSHTFAASVLSSFPTSQDARAAVKQIYPVVSGFLGKGVAGRFVGYLEDAQNFLTFAEWEKGKHPTNTSQAINLVMDTCEVLHSAAHSSKADVNLHYWKSIDGIIQDVHTTTTTTNLTQWAVDALTYNLDGNKLIKRDFLSWVLQPDNNNTYTRKLIEERKEMIKDFSTKLGIA